MTNDLIDARVREVLAGSEPAEAMNEVFDYFYPKLRTMVRRRVFDGEAVEDVVQNVLVRAHSYLPRFRFESSFRSWLYRITENEIRSFCKRDILRKTESLDADLVWEPPSPDGSDATLRSYDVAATIDRMRPRHAEILRLFYFENYSIEEICRLLGVGTSAAKMRLSRARDEFASLWGYTSPSEFLIA